MRAARKVVVERELRKAWRRVPDAFWGLVCVGWRRRIAWVVRRRERELRSWWGLVGGGDWGWRGRSVLGARRRALGGGG